MDIKPINERYTKLAEESCCLSCGGAIDHSKVKKGEVCVDLGSGRGTDALRLANEVGEEGFVYGIDLSDGMIEKSRKMAKKMDVSNVEFIQTNFEQIPIETNKVDLVISNCTINHADNKQLVWNEINRILKKEGRFVVSDIYSTKEVPLIYRNDPEAVAECWAGAVTKDVYLEQLRNAGFINVEIIENSIPYSKGKIEVCSFTIKGFKKNCCCN